MDLAPPSLPADPEPRAPFHVTWDGRQLDVHGELTRPDQLDSLIAALRVGRGWMEDGNAVST